MRSLVYLLGLLVVILALYSYELKEEQEKLEMSVHNMYTNELSNATEKLHSLQEAVSLSLMFDDEVEVNRQLQDVWRLSNELRSNISKLPLDEQTTNDWLRYLGRLGDEAKFTSVKTGEWKTKGKQYQDSLTTLSEDWTIATSNYYMNDTNFKKWEDETMRQTAFTDVSKNIRSMNETDFPITASESDYMKKQSLQDLKDKDWTKQQVIDKFHQLFPALKEAPITVTVNKDDSPYEFYHLKFAWGPRVGYVDFTKKGGHILSFLLERPNTSNVISHEKAKEAADKFLKEINIDDVTFIEARENHEAWHFVYSRVVDGVLVYPDTLQIKIAKDDGEVLGLNLMEYVKKEKIEPVDIPEMDSKKFFSDDVIVEEERMVYVEDDNHSLALCYEWIIRTDGDTPRTFKVVVDSKDQRVLEIDPLK